MFKDADLFQKIWNIIKGILDAIKAMLFPEKNDGTEDEAEG